MKDNVSAFWDLNKDAVEAGIKFALNQRGRPMKLYEFQGKELFAQFGIPIPKGSIVRTIDEIRALNTPLVLKSQVLSVDVVKRVALFLQ